jgi:outer membrane protein assembly factor BamB
MKKYFAGACVLLSLLVVGAYIILQGQGVPEIVPPPDYVAEYVPVAETGTDDWPCWRGPNSDGTLPAATRLLRVSAQNGLLWKTALPGQGHASPIVWHEQVFVCTADEEAQTRSLACYQRQTGTMFWSTVFQRGGFMAKHDKNTHASATPACDGIHVYVPSIADGGLWLTALDLDGRLAWQTKLGPFVSEWGYASSLALYKNLVIVAGENKGSRLGHLTAASSYLAGVHRKTGEIIWRVRRPRAPSYGTPVVARIAGRDQLLLSGAERISAYEPATGRELWSCRWSARRSADSVVCSSDCVFASATFPEAEVLCVRADGAGDVTDSHVVWRQRRGAADVPSPLYHDGRLYLVADKGILTCLDAASGQMLWQHRLNAGCSASPVLAGDAILVTDEEGTIYMFRAGPECELLAKNSLGDAVLASPAISGDRVLLRGRGYLWYLKALSAER